ncbi:hypothetical protein KO02_17615 [Sphingobacterium sp. ML3W]|uniref:hypothetical protein n=1 Tax=Sphingobacterium sp. ML3W TaxID=1538644 RepID=UPI0004F7928B|nr:hypothetical protein [Sphingobacterium sp. ML3W]AIM38301.1 hypothetical protein KO02_17615 [Sphingobacterium sp. ML3W]
MEEHKDEMPEAKIRLLNPRNAYEKKSEKLIGLTGNLADVLGTPDASGIWLVYGKEKHGKTLCSLMLANALSDIKKVLYVSAEEGLSQHFQDSMKRAGIEATQKNLFFSEYLTIKSLKVILRRHTAPKIVVLDNVTAMLAELRRGMAEKLCKEFPNVLFIYVAHMVKNEPYTAIAKNIKIWAKAIFLVEGLKALVSGRVKGGEFNLIEMKAQLYHGLDLKSNNA